MLRGVPGNLAVAQVTPFAWEVAGEVNEFVARAATELSQRGHRVLIVAPSQSRELVRQTRRALREDPGKLLERAANGPVVLGVGEVLPFALTRRRAASLPVDVARTIEEGLESLPLDVVHVHEPFAPGASSSALRYSRALNVASFHTGDERVLSTQLARGLSRLLFARLDARTASYRATRDLMAQFFPGEYRVLAPGADPIEPRREPGVNIVFVAAEERPALRVFLRALRGLPPGAQWRATVVSSRPLAAPATLPVALRDRVSFTEGGENEALAAADILVLGSDGTRAIPGTLLRALAGGAIPVASRIPAYQDFLGEGEFGLEY